MKIFKMLLGGIGLVLLLVIVSLVVFIATFDANAYKQELSAMVKQQTGRELVFTGDIGLTLYPSIGMSLGSMSFANADGFDEAPMLTVTAASVSVDLLSILSMTPEVAQLQLKGLKLNLHKNKQGQTNFDDLTASSSSPSDTPSEDAPAMAGEPDQGLALSGRFGGLNIIDAELTWRDDTSGDEYRLHDLNVTTGPIQLQQPFALDIGLKLDNRQALSAQLTVSAEALIEQRRISLSSIKLNSSATGDMIPVDQADVEVTGAVAYALLTQQLSMQGLAVQLQSRGGLWQQGEVSLAGEVGFDLSTQKLSIAVLDLQAELVDPGMPNGRVNAGLSAAEMAVDLPVNALRLDDLQLTVGDNRFRGYLRANDYLHPDVEFSLASENLDIDKLLGLEDKEKAASQQPEQQDKPPEDVQIALPMELLRNLKLQGQLQIDSLKVSGMSLSSLNVVVKADRGILDVDPFALDLYQGKLAGKVHVNVEDETPRYVLTQALSKFQIGAFLDDFMGDDRISGEANLDISLRTGGEWLSQLKRGLDGELKVDIRDGALKGFNLRHKLDVAKAKFRGEDKPVEQERQTDFSALTLSGQVRKGVFSSQDLDIQAPLMRVGGQGSADLAEETVDYQVNAKLVGTTKGQAGGSAADLSGIPIPVAITGPWLAPNIDVQYDEMMKARLDAEKARLRDQVAREKAALTEKLNAEKTKLRAAQEREAAARKLELEKKRELAIAEEKARLEARKKAEQARAREKLKEKLQKLF